MWIAVVGSLVSGVFALLGALVGAYFTRRAADRDTWIRMLAEFYAEVLTNYGIFAADAKSEPKRSQLIVSIEKARLVCPHETEVRLMELRRAVLKRRDPECASLVKRFRESATQDVDRLKQKGKYHIKQPPGR